MSDENNMFENHEQPQYGNDLQQQGYSEPVQERQGYQPQSQGQPGVGQETPYNGGVQQQGYGDPMQERQGYQPQSQGQPGVGQESPYSGGGQQQGYSEPVQERQGYNPQPYGGQNQHTQNSGYAEPVYSRDDYHTNSQRAGGTDSHSTVSAENGGFGIASMICGIIALITCCLWCTCIPLAVVSIVLGILQINKGTAKGMAIAGIVCSSIALVLLVFLTVFGTYLQTTSEYNDLLRELQYMHYMH